MLVHDSLQECEAIQFRHSDVEKDDVGDESSAQYSQCMLARDTGFYGIAGAGEFHAIHIQKELIVVDIKNRSFRWCITHTLFVSAGSALSGASGSFSPARSKVESVFTSENGTFLSNAFIIASSCMVSMPSARAAAQSLDSTGFSRIIFSILEDISNTSKTAMRPRIPVAQVGVRTASYTCSGIGKRYFGGSEESCDSMFLRTEAPMGTSLAPSGQKVRTRRWAIERINT